jgi:hypothetical protein
MAQLRLDYKAVKRRKSNHAGFHMIAHRKLCADGKRRRPESVERKDSAAGTAAGRAVV